MPPTDPKNRGQARVDAIFQVAKQAQRDATNEALAEAFGGDAPSPEPAASSEPATGQSDESVTVGAADETDKTSPQD